MVLKKNTNPEELWLLQKEKVLAWLRVGFSLVAILVIQLNPDRAARFPILSQISLYSFLLYSLLILYLTKGEKSDSRKIGLATTCLDLFWVSFIVFSTGGSRTPFFVYYLFPVITASSRYGIKGSVIVAFIGVVFYGFIRFSSSSERPIDIDTFIIRSIYLLALAYIFGFLSEFEKKQNQKLMALYKTASETAAREERSRIIRELHDRLLQVLASLRLRLEICRKRFLNSPQQLEDELSEMEEITQSSLKEVRAFLSEKTLPIGSQASLNLQPGTFQERLIEEMEFLRDKLGIRAIFETTPEKLDLAPKVEQEVYYVLREGLANLARHAQASRAELLLKEVDAELQGSIEDDGVGFDLANAKGGKGYGLVSMEERIKKLGGRLSIETFPGRGTKVFFRVPLKAETVGNEE
ncbi:MAG: sensor histidine kinase [Candidatus Binatia bacterium]